MELMIQICLKNTQVQSVQRAVQPRVEQVLPPAQGAIACCLCQSVLPDARPVAGASKPHLRPLILLSNLAIAELLLSVA